MKHFIFPLLLFSLLAGSNKAIAQQRQQRLRCGTMEALDLYLKSHPQAKAVADKNKNMYTTTIKPSVQQRTTSTELVIPVVVHLVLPEADQAKVTEADVMWQINRLNEDFSGFNSDSANATNFYHVRGHSNIRFCMAKKDPAGNPTNGIDRIVSNISNFSFNNLSQLKSKNGCGAEAWDTDKYFNIWVAKSTELVGIATFPGMGPANEQGITIALDGFSNNPAYVSSSFNKGRTAVHETGHFLGLYHIWGDEAGCTTSDFRQLPGNCIIAGSDIVGSSSDMTVGDTPNQGDATNGCASGTKIDSCNKTTPGVQYQNFMDYTDDNCYSMFTALQVKRMEYMLTNCRSSLLTSGACTPAAQVTTDASLNAILNPGTTSCRVAALSSFCIGSTIKPVVEIKNLGTATLTSVKIVTQVDNGNPSTFSWSGSLASMSSTLVTLPPFTATARGQHTLTIYTTNPNGAQDGRPANDTLRFTYEVAQVNTLTAVEEGFDNSTFPPPGWRVVNPDGDLTWQHNTSIGRKRAGSAWFRDWDNATNNRYDDLMAPIFTYSNIDSVFVLFDVANAMYSDTNTTNQPIDTLSVLLSKDCGNTFTTVYKKWGKELQTVRSWPQDQEFFPQSANHWRRDSVNLGKFLGTSEESFQLTFRFNGNYENNIFLDDVLLYTRVVPTLLKEKGLLVAPTITRNQFGVWHYQQPTTLRSVKVYTATGQVVFKREFKGNADKYIAVNLSGQSAGVYFVHLAYENASQNVTQRIVKQ